MVCMTGVYVCVRVVLCACFLMNSRFPVFLLFIDCNDKNEAVTQSH